MKTKFNFLLALCLVLASGSYATVRMVNVSNFQFAPATLNVNVGDTIMWMWLNGDHTTTSATIPAGAAAWDHDISSTSTSFMYKITAAGTYNYVCTPHAPNMAGTIIAAAATGVAGVNAGSISPIYPNPATGSIHLDLGHVKGTASILIIDAAGRVVYTSSATDSLDINTASFTAGVYTLKLAAGNIQESHTFSIVK